MEDVPNRSTLKRWHFVGTWAWLLLSGCRTDPSLAQQHFPSTQRVALSAATEDYADRPRLNGTATVVLTLQTAQAGQGSITLELDGAAAPLTAGHFAHLVQQGFWDGLSFYQVEKDPEPFVVRAGDPTKLRTPRPRPIPLEILVRGEGSPRYNTPVDVTQGSRVQLPHREGAVAMARSTSPDSATSEFYITLAALPILDGRYAVFGYVTSGLELVHQIQVGDQIIRAELVPGS